MNREVIVGKIYRHMSGSYYRVLCIAKDSENQVNGEPKSLVVYESLGRDRAVWVRSYDLFQEKVDKTKYPNCVQEYRFELVDDNISFR